MPGKTISRMCALTLSVVACGLVLAHAQPEPEQSIVRKVKLPMDLPSIGELENVKEWRFGRVHHIERRGANELNVDLRTSDGKLIRITSPREPLATLARECKWVADDWRVVAGRREYAERMVAFGMDDEGRMVAVISLEPFDRDRNRLRRAVGR